MNSLLKNRAPKAYGLRNTILLTVPEFVRFRVMQVTDEFIMAPIY